MKTKEELFKIYSAYLPYDLMFQRYDSDFRLKSIQKRNDGFVSLEFSNTKLVISDFIEDEDGVRTKFKPILYSMDMLTKEIEHKGERFIPMIKLLELQETNHFSKNKNIKDVTIFDAKKVIDCETKKFEFHTEWTEHGVRYLVETSNMGTLIYCLIYDEGFDRFHHRDETRNMTLGVGYQRQMFEKLYEWHFNVFGLDESEYIKK